MNFFPEDFKSQALIHCIEQLVVLFNECGSAEMADYIQLDGL